MVDNPSQRLGSSPAEQVVEVAISGSCDVCTGWQSPVKSMAASRSTKSPRSSLDGLAVVLGRLVKFNLAERLVEHRRLEGSLEASWESKKKKVVCTSCFRGERCEVQFERLWNEVGVLFQVGREWLRAHSAPDEQVGC